MGGQGECERRIEVFVKIFGRFWGAVGRGSGGGRGGCEQRIEVIVKMQKKTCRWGFRVQLGGDLGWGEGGVGRGRGLISKIGGRG